ncbi:MAG: ImmA/IrrE family metallo-endopeptidase [Methylacidiphilales bacterium]|nr:ImmA/IrrE family metallo-endopeptidase [Candidatus Methylacidiphilales bacterium]
MSTDPRTFKAPFIDQQQCWNEADRFRQQYWSSGEIPVDVLAIAEFDLNLEIRTITGLKENADVDALLLGDWTTLIVDQQQYLDDRFINRLRFSIAHELGHYVLHEEVFKAIPRGNSDEWIVFMQDMPDKEYGLLEYHANEFAGRFLVPIDSLKTEFENVLSEVEQNGMARHNLSDAHLSYLCIPLARRFAVSEEVIERRLTREKLWPL